MRLDEPIGTDLPAWPPFLNPRIKGALEEVGKIHCPVCTAECRVDQAERGGTSPLPAWHFAPSSKVPPPPPFSGDAGGIGRVQSPFPAVRDVSLKMSCRCHNLIHFVTGSCQLLVALATNVGNRQQ